MSEKERIYLLSREGNLYKTNLHCHSTVSDGRFTPEELKEMYKERGYHALCYTDHQLCVPHNELTDKDFVALTGIEIAFGIRQGTSIHVCGIARDPMAEIKIPNKIPDDVALVNEGIELLKSKGYITTLNHPRWSGMSARTLEAIDDTDNMEVLNGYEAVQDGYGDSAALYELELRRGRKVRPFATDDSHTATTEGGAGYEYFNGFTVIKAKELSYSELIAALDRGDYYASTGPTFKNLWIEDGVLHVECSAVCGVYVHGTLYRHRATVVCGSDAIESADIDIGDLFADSEYVFVQIVDTKGRRAWASPYWFDKK